MKTVVLCGFMGCGKSTVGKSLAQLTGRAFADTDALVEAQTGMTAAAIFREQGEAAFRAYESRVCRELAQKQHLVIATGGGAVLAPENAAAFRRTCTLVYLEVPFETIWARVKNAGRPLVTGKEALRVLFEQRLPLYERAAHFCVSGEQSPLRAAQEIAEKL